MPAAPPQYNSNFDASEAITRPDPVSMAVLNVSSDENPRSDCARTRPDGSCVYFKSSCYQGASARAIEMVASSHGYVVVNRSLGYDLFLVRRDLWKWEVPSLESLDLKRCMNTPMLPRMAVNLLDYSTLVAKEGDRHTPGQRVNPRSVCRARRAAVRALLQAAARPGACSCFSRLSDSAFRGPIQDLAVPSC